MAAVMTDWIDHFRIALKGMRVSHVWRGHGSALFLEFGQLTPKSRRDGNPADPDGEIGLMVQWHWRIEEGRSIVCGSTGDEALWPPAFDKIVGLEIKDLSTFGHLPELHLSLEKDFSVLSFQTEEGNPGWVLFDRREGERQLTVHCEDGVIQEEQHR